MRLALRGRRVASAAGAQTPPVAAPPSVPPTPERTAAEDAVAATLAQPGVHVVHFWAPWCGNSRAEYEAGWYEAVDAHPDVTFSFVTIWNDGEAAADRLARWGIEASDHVFVYAQPDLGPSADRSLRRRSFLGLPVTWTPTTWVFNRDGQLAYAFNYGEVAPDQLATAIAHARDTWTHD